VKLRACEEGEEDIMTVEDYLECVESGSFIDYDGFGHPIVPVINGEEDKSIFLYPSEGSSKIPEGVTHIKWYNR